MTVLVIDDESSIRTTLKIFLEREGYTVHTAESAVDALDRVRNFAYDVILSDIIMPRMSGVELLAGIRDSLPDVPVILMTGEPTVETAVFALQNGAFDYISKPVLKEILLKVVRQASHVRELVLQKQELERRNKAYQENLEHEVRCRTSELDKSMQETIKILTTLVDSRDPYTSGHQIRVGNLSAAIASQMGLPEKTVTGLRVTGYLHDIGKISVPSELLVKPGRLSIHEFELVKTHSESGYNILKTLSLPWPIGDIVSQHHERLDGSGYPMGLHGPDILLEARIIAVADVVEAMSSHRPYRASLGIQAALDEINQYKGTKFDREVVDACRDLFEKMQYEIPEEYTVSSFLV